MKHVAVKSGQIKSIAYDPQSKDMEVIFASGGTYTYHGVSRADHMKLMAAKSIGGHLSAHIKGGHKFTKKEAKK